MVLTIAVLQCVHYPCRTVKIHSNVDFLNTDKDYLGDLFSICPASGEILLYCCNTLSGLIKEAETVSQTNNFFGCYKTRASLGCSRFINQV